MTTKLHYQLHTCSPMTFLPSLICASVNSLLFASASLGPIPPLPKACDLLPNAIRPANTCGMFAHSYRSTVYVCEKLNARLNSSWTRFAECAPFSKAGSLRGLKDKIVIEIVIAMCPQPCSVRINHSFKNNNQSIESMLSCELGKSQTNKYFSCVFFSSRIPPSKSGSSGSKCSFSTWNCTKCNPLHSIFLCFQKTLNCFV